MRDENPPRFPGLDVPGAANSTVAQSYEAVASFRLNSCKNYQRASPKRRTMLYAAEIEAIPATLIA